MVLWHALEEHVPVEWVGVRGCEIILAAACYHSILYSRLREHSGRLRTALVSGIVLACTSYFEVASIIRSQTRKWSAVSIRRLEAYCSRFCDERSPEPEPDRRGGCCSCEATEMAK